MRSVMLSTEGVICFQYFSVVFCWESPKAEDIFADPGFLWIPHDLVSRHSMRAFYNPFESKPNKPVEQAEQEITKWFEWNKPRHQTPEPSCPGPEQRVSYLPDKSVRRSGVVTVLQEFHRYLVQERE